MAKSSSITLSDIAREANVSRRVVSAILHPTEKNRKIGYSQETYDRVKEVIGRYHYRPNRSARSLQGQQHGIIGILVQSVGNIPTSSMYSMLFATQDNRQMITMEQLSRDPSELPVMIKEDCVDGIIVFENLPAEILDHLRELELPTVYVNCNIRDRIESITYDEEGGALLAAERLVKGGSRHLGFIGGPSTHYSAEARRLGFREACQKLGLPAPIEFPEVADAKSKTGKPEEKLSSQLLEFLRSNPDIDGILLANDWSAPDLYHACKQLGKTIPEDIQVIGINNSETAKAIEPRLTALGVDSFAIGEKAIETVNRQLDMQAIDGPLSFPFILHERESTR